MPVLVGVVLAVALSSASPAYAHNSLTGSTPANGARIATAPTTVELRFLAKLDPARTKITVVGPDNIPAAGGAPSFSGSRVSVPFTPGAAGLYIVEYRLPSSDGHPVKGEVRFTLTTGTAAVPPSPSATPSASAAPPPTESSSPASASSSADPVPAAGADDAGRGWLWAGGGLALLVALATGLFLRRRSTRP